ncbi:unnamed protein product [Vicia faba]|uniref:Methyltransferase n=1 Tax=Vicia faba TaxID=3906 RepID=A0AAV1AQ17_VICFA|nr:unnamed protein product [Vicia faba]
MQEMIELGSDAELHQAGVRTTLDINCGFGSFGAHLLSLNIMSKADGLYNFVKVLGRTLIGKEPISFSKIKFHQGTVHVCAVHGIPLIIVICEICMYSTC